MKHTKPTAASSVLAVAPVGLRGVSEAAEARLPNFSYRTARVSGEAFDADQLGWSCDECGREEYGCECDVSEPDSAAEHRVAESLRQIDWCRQGRGKPDGFERVEF